MKPFTLQEIAALTQSKLIGDPQFIITSFADLETANENEISFFARPKFDHARYETALQATKAGALFVDPETLLLPNRNLLIHPFPSIAFQKILELMMPPVLSAFTRIHPIAWSTLIMGRI